MTLPTLAEAVTALVFFAVVYGLVLFALEILCEDHRWGG